MKEPVEIGGNLGCFLIILVCAAAIVLMKIFG